MNMLFKSRAEHPNQSDRTTSNTVSPDNQSEPLSHICMPYLEMCLDHRVCLRYKNFRDKQILLFSLL